MYTHLPLMYFISLLSISFRDASFTILFQVEYHLLCTYFELIRTQRGTNQLTLWNYYIS